MVIVNNAHQFCLSLLNIAKSNTLKATTQIHALTCKTCLDQCHLIAGKLLLRYAVELPDDGALDHARRLLAHFPNPDSFMYNSLLRGFSDDPLQAFDIFKEMHRREASVFDSFTFSFAFKAAANLGALSVGSQLHCRALVHGLGTHLFVGTTMVSFYGECGELEFARKVFDEMSERNVIAWNAILTACFRCGDVRGGEAVFERMPERDLTSWDVVLAGYVRAGEIELAWKMFTVMPVKDDVSWSTMIVGFSQNGCYDDAFRLFMDLCCAGERPNEASLSGVLSASAQAGAFQFTRIVHGFIEKSGFLWMVSVNNALLDAYSKCGNISMARMVFESMSKKSLVSWTSMIASLAMHGHGEEAIRVLHEMEGFGIKPDGITYISILYACSHAGLIDEAEFYFSKMVEQGIEPNIEHYGCMVDLYGRAGKLKKAYTFASQMPVSPNAVIWRTLLGACSLHRNAKLAEQVKQKLSSLDPANSGDHVLLSNVYAVNKRWESVASVRRSMSEQGIRKTPGWSAIEVNNFLHSFVAGEKDNEAHEKLKEVMSRLRVEGGYVAEVGSVLHDIEEEEKEDSVTSHSEKLAVAFGMARLPKGEVIRVVKNLRICRDCHNVMKLISKVYGLEIVVRDRSRFHSFRGGFCSCGDYW